ncbi:MULTISPECIES: DinB family protein [unclassified Streptomyces]|uniref:DinB family protein n=1 Tax=unclassified Streptomyces TaxID=2593676 RepID=UPI002259E950|nr:DinB family protein [Streptomyces sp. NBC_00338]MCX5139090.1 DinB family protein [Streptomyces sp. NBC_00338]
MTHTERAMPPLQADERTNLAAWLDFYRATVATKCDGLTDGQVREASVAPSELTLLGIVQHLTEVERNWFRRVLTGEDVPPVHGAPAAPGDHDGGFGLSDGTSFADARAAWLDEIEVSRANCAARSLEDTAPFMGGEVALRWIYTHMIAEYARHSGHADLLRERIDGSTGV